MGGRDQCHRGCPLQCQVCKCRLTPAGKGSPMLTPAARGRQSNQVLEVVLPAAREVQCTPANSRGCLAARTLHALSSYWTYLTKYLCQYTSYMDGLQEPARSLSTRRRGWQTVEALCPRLLCFYNFCSFDFDRESVSSMYLLLEPQTKTKKRTKPQTHICPFWWQFREEIATSVRTCSQQLPLTKAGAVTY